MTTRGGSRRSPPDESPEGPAAAPSTKFGTREILEKGISRAPRYSGVLVLALGSTAAAATVGGWPTVVAMTIMVIGVIVLVALGLTFSLTETQVDATKVHQYQLTFARRAPLHMRLTSPLPLEPSVDDRNGTCGSAAVIRAWATSEGLEVHRSGPLPRNVVAAWESRQGRTLRPTAAESHQRWGGGSRRAIPCAGKAGSAGARHRPANFSPGPRAAL
jgi:hypothetical protein